MMRYHRAARRCNCFHCERCFCGEGILVKCPDRHECTLHMANNSKLMLTFFQENQTGDLFGWLMCLPAEPKCIYAKQNTFICRSTVSSMRAKVEWEWIDSHSLISCIKETAGVLELVGGFVCRFLCAARVHNEMNCKCLLNSCLQN